MKLVHWTNLSSTEKRQLLQRPMPLEATDRAIKIAAIINEIQMHGDAAVLNYTQQFDGVLLAQLQVQPSEFNTARNQVSPQAMGAIEFAKKQIENYHQAQLPQDIEVSSCPGVVCERRARPIQSVGLYIPGGTAPLVSTLLMLAVPAALANCPTKIMCTPPNTNGEINPYLLMAAQLCGIQKIYKVGGVQAIAAMAYGTESIEKVDKIFGPGNAWVTAAKRAVAQDPNGASIDMPAGPSEVLVIADDDANVEFVAADLLSQAEHGIDSQVILISLSQECALNVIAAIEKQLKSLPRHVIAAQALAHSKFIVADNLATAFEICNRYAPEHVILQMDEAEKYVDTIINAGAVFVGPWAAETLGDYVTGSNHVLPTYGYAKTFSGLSVSDFMKFISIQTISRSGLEKIGPYAEILAEIEGLDAHKQAVTKRLQEERVS